MKVSIHLKILVRDIKFLLNKEEWTNFLSKVDTSVSTYLSLVSLVAACQGKKLLPEETNPFHYK